ncbi:hypothetical protein ABNG29_27845 [Bacillus thuringiensis]
MGTYNQFIEFRLKICVCEELLDQANTDGKTPIDSGGAFIEIEW